MDLRIIRRQYILACTVPASSYKLMLCRGIILDYGRVECAMALPHNEI